MVAMGGVVMSTNHLFTLLLILAVSVGCGTTGRQSSSNVAETPPYLQPRSEQGKNQMADMRAFHEKDTEKMSGDLRAAHSREMAQSREMGGLGTNARDLERDKRWQEDLERTQAQRQQQTSEKRTGWSWFKKPEDDSKKEASAVMNSRIGGISTTVR